MSPEVFLKVYKSLVRPILDYNQQANPPLTAKVTTMIESVQRRATKNIYGFKNLTYAERLTKLQLHSLVYRRFRGKLIQTWRTLTEHNHPNQDIFNLKSETKRGHKYLIEYQRCSTRSRQEFLPEKMKKSWDSLPPEIEEAEMERKFK